MKIANLPRGSWTVAYIGTVALINWLFVVVEPIQIMGEPLPPVMLIVGFVFVFRDFAQREIGHWVFAAMLLAAAISYFTSSPAVALASLTAFTISEIADWAVYSFTKRPLSERILYSSLVSVPIDTGVFLFLVNYLSPQTLILVTLAKLIGALCFWVILRRKETRVTEASSSGIA